jgi:ubiquinone/menaquinone biosynthesis C-methylase UbiE
VEEFDFYRSGAYTQVLGTGQVGKQMNRIHRQMEAPFSEMHFSRILEIGAGTGEHSEFVRSAFDEYYMTDIRIDLLQPCAGSMEGLFIEEQNVQSLSYEDSYFDRIIMTCVIAHVPDPMGALTEIRRVAMPGAKLTIYVPCEPGILLRAARQMTTVPKNRKAGVKDPYFHHFQEHVHYYLALNHYIRRVFNNDSIKSRYYPFGIGTWNMNLYRLYQITISGTSL